MTKPVRFLGNSRAELQSFPKEVRRTVGEELRIVQQGDMPTDFKPMPSIGKGVYEIRVNMEGAWRVMYVAKFVEAIYVLRAFHKKVQQTAKDDIEIAKKRYRTIGG